MGSNAATMTRGPAGWTDSIGARFGLVATLNLCGIAVAVMLASRDETSMAAVFPPWWGEAHSLEAAGSAGAIVSTGRLPTVVLVRATGPDLARRLRAAGALFILPSFRFGPCTSNDRDMRE